MKEIVVGLDGSAASDRALDHAVVESRTSGRPLRAVHAWTTPVWVGGMPGVGYNVLANEAESRVYHQDLLDDQLAKAQTRWPGLEVTGQAVQGPTRKVLLHAAEDAALLVLAGHGYGELKSALLGSSTLYALHHTGAPVMVVPDEGSPSEVVQRVVVGVDDSDGARSALRWGHDAAKRHGCPLVVLHAWLISTLPDRPRRGYVPSLREYETEAQTWLDGEVARVLPDLDDVPVRTELSHSTASWSLLDKAGPDDLLVVGARGSGGFTELLLGSTAAQCAQHARGTVVVVRAGQERLAS